MRGKILVLHCEFFNSYRNKNLGYFIQFCLSSGYQLDFVTLAGHSEEYDGGFGRGFNLIQLDASSIDSSIIMGYLSAHAREYDFAWLYPLYRKLFWIIALLWLRGVKPILKLDNIRLVRGDESLLRRIAKIGRVNLIYMLAYRIIYEKESLTSGFVGKHKFRRFTLGLSDGNLALIRNLEVTVPREKRIVYSGRIIRAKGLDRLVEAFTELKVKNKIPPEWRLHVVGKEVEADFAHEIRERITKTGMDSEIVFTDEKSGVEYYKEIIQSSLIVLPSRSEGLPNILADAYFSHRLFLSTNVAKCGEFITDPLFFCEDDTDSIRNSIERIITAIDFQYSRFDQVYPKTGFVEADPFFAELVGWPND